MHLFKEAFLGNYIASTRNPHCYMITIHQSVNHTPCGMHVTRGDFIFLLLGTNLSLIFTAEYKDSGKGYLKLQLINQRSDFSFALFFGGLSNVCSQMSISTYLHDNLFVLVEAIFLMQ